MNWIPIDQHPEDGTDALIYSQRRGDFRVATYRQWDGWYHSGYGEVKGDFYAVITYPSEETPSKEERLTQLIPRWKALDDKGCTVEEAQAWETAISDIKAILAGEPLPPTILDEFP